MQFSAVLLAGFAALVSAQTYTGTTVTDTAPAPSGCASTYSGTFELSVANGSTSTRKSKRSGEPNALTISLNNGLLTDSEGRLGYIASNYQFQFDFGGQAGEIFAAGFSVCPNNTLALGSSAVWYECLSGSFYNLYNDNWAPQCKPVFLDVIAVSSGSISTSTAVATQTSDGQVGGTTVVPATTSSAAIVTSITDHQVQGATTTTPVTSSAAVVTSVVTSSAAIVTSISDHQIQGATTTTAVVSSVAIVSSISDHQIQAPTTTAVVTAYTGAAAMPTMAAQMLLAAAGAAVALF